MGTDVIDSDLQCLIDLIYSRPERHQDPAALMPQCFDALRRLFPFSSGVYLPIDPVGGTLCQGHGHQLHHGDQDDTRDCLTRCQPLAPEVLLQPALKNPDTVVRISDTDQGTDIGRTACGTLGECRYRVPGFHSLAMIPLLRGAPLGIFSVHRGPWQRDFDRPEMALFQWFVHHAATGIDYLNLRQRLEQPHPLAIVVLTRAGRIEALTAEAQRILESLPDTARQALPGPMESSRTWRYGCEAYVVRTRRVDRSTMIGLSDAGSLPPPALDQWAARLRVATKEQRQHLVVTIERLEVNSVVRGEVFGIDLTPQ